MKDYDSAEESQFISFNALMILIIHTGKSLRTKDIFYNEIIYFFYS